MLSQRPNQIKEIPTESMDTQENTIIHNTDNPHDKGYKRIFSIKKNFLDFLKKYVGLEWMMCLTENELELIDKEYITDQFDTYESDLVYKVNTTAGSVYLFFLFELQSSNDFTMPFRLLVYITAIWLDYFKNCGKDERKRKDYRLPAVMPIVLYNGERNWTASRSFKEMIDHADMFGKYVVNFDYILVSVNKLAASKIKSSNTLVDNIFLADQKRTKQEWLDGIAELVHRIRIMDKEDLNEWITWFSNVIRKLNEDERKSFIAQLRKGDETVMCSSFERILDKEKAEGRAEERAKSILELLEELGELSESLRNHILEERDLEVLRKWHKAAARAESIEDFEQSAGLVQIS